MNTNQARTDAAKCCITGLKTPSYSVYKIGEQVEKTLKLNFSRELVLNSRETSLPRRKLVQEVLSQLVGADLFAPINDHLFDEEFSVGNHRNILLKLLSEQYVVLKLHHKAKLLTQKSIGQPIRHSLTKQIIFRHQ